MGKLLGSTIVASDEPRLLTWAGSFSLLGTLVASEKASVDIQ